jgi:AraC-like DNA-binding protein
MISLMLNQLSGTNFYDFVNRYRLEEFKRRSREDRYADLPAITLAEQCGFKKTTFFAAFRKFEGCTPGEWAEGRGKKADMP